MSDRDALRGLAMIAASQLRQLSGILNRIDMALEEASEMAVAAEHQIHSAQTLVNQAVGTGAGAPEPGERMAEYTALATDTISGTAEGGNVLTVILLAVARVAAAQVQVDNAAANAEMYAAIP